MDFIREKIAIILGIFLLIAVAAVGTYVYSMHSSIADLQTKNSQLTSQRDQALVINAGNVAVIAQLKADKALYEKNIGTLLANQAASANKLNAIAIAVQNKADGPLAPVLRDTIDQIQQNRKGRTQ